MAPTIPTVEPTVIVAGDTVKWTKSLADFPAADSWELKYTFVSASGQFDVTSTVSGANHLLTILAATSANFDADDYSWQGYATLSAERYLFATGSAVIKANFDAETGAYDARTTIHKTMVALEAMTLGKASIDQSSMSIAGRSLARYSPEELITWLEKYKAWYAEEVRRENIANGLGNSNKIRIRFLN